MSLSLSHLDVVFCQVEVSASGRTLIQRSPTECMCVCVCVCLRPSACNLDTSNSEAA